jgi:hypothetical protein
MTVKALAKTLPIVVDIRSWLGSYLRIVGIGSFVFLQVAWLVLIAYLFVSLVS